MPESRLEQRLQKLLDRALYHAVGDRGNPQGSELPRFARLGDELASARAGSKCSLPKCLPQVLQVGPFAHVATNASHGLPVDARCAFALVPAHAPPRASQIADIGYPIPQIAIGIFGMCLTPLIQLSLHAE